MLPVKYLRGHALLLGLIVLIVAALYAQVTGAWFCGYDDFNEAHRAAFSDAREPVQIVTATHNVGYMYRPVTSGLQYVTWTAFHHSPLAFRLRNLTMHLLSVAMLYGILWLTLGSRSIAAAAALLFGVHPMANETISVAIWTNATAYALFFTSFFLFVYSLRVQDQARSWELPLAGSLISALLAIFAYEPTVVVFALMAGYLWLWSRQHGRPTKSYLWALIVPIVVELAFFLAVRHAFITARAPLNAFSIIIRNTVLYAAGLMLPIDLVLAHVLFGTPLPTQTRFAPGVSISVVLAVAAIGIAALALHPAVRARLRGIDWRMVAYIAAAIPATLLPLLLFREHPSEHDLYPGVALYTALLSILLCKLTRSQAAFWIVTACFAVSFAAGTWVRNERVSACAAIAQGIMAQLPVDQWRQGQWYIRLATEPGERLSEPYGIYNDAGLHALETETGDTPGAQEAVQIATENDRITVRIVSAETLLQHCFRPHTCFWVSSSGHVRDAISGVDARASQ